MFLTGCGDDDAASDDPATTGTTAPAATTTTEAGSTTSTSEPDTTPVATDEVANVYWAWTVDTTSAQTPEQLGAGGRSSGSGAAMDPADAVAALLEGPNELETEIGMITEIPDGTELLAVEVGDGVAVVDLSSDFEESNGTLGETLAIAQVVFTLTQFDTVDAVSFRIDGSDVDALGSHGTDVSVPLTRDDFDTSVRPLILLESPTPGAVVGDEVVIRGEANTFEANVVYAVTDGDGLIVAEGFTTATAGNGTWGTFEETVTVEPETAGVGAVIVWEESAEDGSQINVVEYPVDVGAAS
jgi:spore germination protein GerM